MASKLLLALCLCLCLALSVQGSPLLERLQSQLNRRAPAAAAATLAATPATAAAASAAAPASTPTIRVLSAGFQQLQSMGSLSHRMAASTSTASADLSTGAIIGIVIGGVVLLFLLSYCCFRRDVIFVRDSRPATGGTTIVNTQPAQPAPGTTVITN